jgi:hypothetical protein
MNKKFLKMALVCLTVVALSSCSSNNKNVVETLRNDEFVWGNKENYHNEKIDFVSNWENFDSYVKIKFYVLVQEPYKHNHPLYPGVKEVGICFKFAPLKPNIKQINFTYKIKPKTEKDWWGDILCEHKNINIYRIGHAYFELVNPYIIEKLKGLTTDEFKRDYDIDIKITNVILKDQKSNKI